jgi:hypothetical protein
MTSLQQTAMGGGSATAKTASYVLVAADAGGTVAMNAAGATTITVNTALFAAGDTVFIQNLGAGACTVTAGTATVATAGSLILPQNDAGILYFTATGAAIFYDYIQAGAVSPLTTKGDLYTFSTSDARLGVGANGTTLVADSSEATGLKWQAASSGGFTYVGGSTFTTSSAVNVNDVFSTTYANYIIRTDIVGSAAVAISMRLRVSGSDSSAATYQDMNVTAYGSTVEANVATNATFFRIPGSGSAGAYYNLMVFNPFETAKTGLTMQSVNYATTAIELTNSSMAFSGATSFTGFSLFPSSGTITGTVRVYGLANS